MARTNKKDDGSETPVPPADTQLTEDTQTSIEQSTASDPAAAAPSQDEAATPDADESRTAFVSGIRPGEQCICPDGRTGTVHKFDEGLVCIPNHDQG